MPIEPLQFNNNQQNSVNDINRIDPLKYSRERIEDEKDNEKESDDRQSQGINNIQDSVSLSLEALNVISATQNSDALQVDLKQDEDIEQTNIQRTEEENIRINLSREESITEENNFVQNAIEFRALEVSSESRQLSPLEQNRRDDLLENISNNPFGRNIDPAEIIEIASASLSSLESEVSNVRGRIDSGSATGFDFERVNDINEILNETNGFGNTELSREGQQELGELNNRFSSAIRDLEDREASEEEIDELSQLQREINTVKGFEINVLDSIGRNGVIV